jgi:hypothetical protein
LSKLVLPPIVSISVSWSLFYLAINWIRAIFLEKKLHSLPQNRLNELPDKPMTKYLLLLKQIKLHLAWLITEPSKYSAFLILSLIQRSKFTCNRPAYATFVINFDGLCQIVTNAIFWLFITILRRFCDELSLMKLFFRLIQVDFWSFECQTDHLLWTRIKLLINSSKKVLIFTLKAFFDKKNHLDLLA